MFSRVLNDGFFLRSFSSQIQNWKRIMEKAKNKLSLVVFGSIPKKINCSLCTLLMSAGKMTYLAKNESCHFRVTGQSKNKCKKVSSGTGSGVPVQKAQLRD
jgi:hypothetical protein